MTEKSTYEEVEEMFAELKRLDNLMDIVRGLKKAEGDEKSDPTER